MLAREFLGLFVRLVDELINELAVKNSGAPFVAPTGLAEIPPVVGRSWGYRNTYSALSLSPL